MTVPCPNVDPFTRVYNAIMALFADHDGVSDLVKPGNLVSYATKSRDPLKVNVQSGDLPEIEVRPAGGEATLWKTSDSTEVIRRYVVGIATGDLRVDESLFPLEWELLRALAGTTSNLGLPFVVNVHIEGFDEESEATDRHRGTKGWVALFTVGVQMYFNRQNHLLAAEPDFGA